MSAARVLVLILLAFTASAFGQGYIGNYSANPYAPNSTANPYGAGNPYGASSINNPYSRYGNSYSPKSVTNPYATQGPALYDSQGRYHGRLSNIMLIILPGADAYSANPG